MLTSSCWQTGTLQEGTEVLQFAEYTLLLSSCSLLIVLFPEYLLCARLTVGHIMSEIREEVGLSLPAFWSRRKPAGLPTHSG